MINLEDKLAQEYLAECREHLASFETDLLAIEKGGPEMDEELVNRLFRAAHSIKGGAGFFDLAKMGELAHRMEDALGLLRSQRMVLTTDRAGVLLRACDRLHELIQQPDTSNQADVAGILADLSVLHVDSASSSEKNRAPAVDHAHRGGMRLRVLVVDDDLASQLLLQTFFIGYGECDIAVNGKDAVEAARSALERRQKYDLICMDIMMPEMDGREAVRQVRALEEDHGILSTYGAKIIMTTAVDDMKEVIQCFQDLCDAYLTKPIDLAELRRQMKSYRLVR